MGGYRGSYPAMCAIAIPLEVDSIPLSSGSYPVTHVELSRYCLARTVLKATNIFKDKALRASVGSIPLTESEAKQMVLHQC